MSIDAAYALCEDTTRKEARNFSYGIRLLPPDKRRAMCAVYALARRVDDIGDGDLPVPQKTIQLAAVREALHRLCLGDTPKDPVLLAVADVARRFPLPLAAFDELIDGCQADVDGVAYSSFDELVHYCRCVAGSIGRLSVGVYNPREKERAWPLADSLGVALQLTNILRDICEDRHSGRVYLPKQDLDAFGCTLDVDVSGHIADPPDRFAALVRFQAARAEGWYAEGLRLLPLLDHRSAACTAAMAGIYRRLLARIVADPDPVRSQRLSLPRAGKLRVAARALVWGRA